MKKGSAFICSILALLLLWGCSAAAPSTTDPNANRPNEEEAQLHLSISDTYDLQAMGYRLVEVSGQAVQADGNTVKAVAEGYAQVTVADEAGEHQFTVQVWADAKSLGQRFPVDRGMFGGKNVILFGDSISQGWICEPGVTIDPSATYFAKLCQYLGAATDPTDYCKCNLAQGGTTLTMNNSYGISGVERVSRSEPFLEDNRSRDAYNSILSADLCVISYGSNDLWVGALAQCAESSLFDDEPQQPWQVNSIRGGMYYMIQSIRKLNPNVKFLILPPLLRRADGVVLGYSEDKTDVINLATGQSMRMYSQVMQQVAQEEGARFVDWTGLFTYEDLCEDYTNLWSYDGLHPHRAGHQRMFEYLMQQLNKPLQSGK